MWVQLETGVRIRKCFGKKLNEIDARVEVKMMVMTEAPVVDGGTVYAW